MKLSKLLAPIFVLATASCSTPSRTASIDITYCAVLVRDSVPICRCVRPDDTMFTLSIEQCAEERYNAMSPDDAAKLFDYLFDLSSELKRCEDQK